MKLASSHKNRQQYYEISAQEMLYPVFESRTKEALWLEDLPLALERASRFVQMCPFDPRARLNLAQVLLEQEKIKEALTHYRAATQFGPPGTEVAWFMLGQCYEALGQNEDAINDYRMSLHYDPEGISNREAILRLKTENLTAEATLLRRWLGEEAKRSVTSMSETNSVKPYQKRQFDENAKMPDAL